MRKFSTSLFIAVLALLALPERAWAWTSVEFLASFDGWAEGHTMTRNDANSFTYEFDASVDFTFKFYVSDNNGLWLGSYDTNSQTVTNYDGNVTYWCSNISENKDITFKVDPRYTRYKIDLLWNKVDGGNHYFTYTVTGITEGGSSDPESKYILMKGNGTNEGSKVATFTGKNFPYTATYNIGAAGTYYFYVNDGAKNYFHTNQEITTDGGSATIYQYNDNYFDRVVKLIAPRAGEYTFKFNHVADTEYTLQCNFPSETETKYTVNISAGEGGSVDPSGDKQIGSTPVNITATPNTGYEFVNWTATGGAKVANASSATTTVTATQDGTLTANFKATSTDPNPDPTPTPTPIPGFYLVGDFLNTDKSINYNCRYFKLSEIAAATAARDGVEEYSINIPTTLAVNVQVLAINEDGSTALYGPSGTLTINKENPAKSGYTTDELVAAERTLTNYSKFEDRTIGRTEETPDANDGIYTITITVTNGVPTNYTIAHNPLTRVAYYLPNTPDASVKESLNSRDQETGSFNNVFFGRVYLPKGVACYVLSNYLGNYDSNKKTDTKTKLYLQGNKSGGNPDTNADGAEKDNYTKVYPITKDDGTHTDAKAFTFSETEIVAMNLEYAPRRGKNDDGYKAEDIYGEVIRSTSIPQTDGGTSVDIPTIKVLKMVGPAVGDDTWDYSQGVAMDYNMAEQCWEATITTTAAAGAKFRFVANDTWKNSWQENGTEDKDKAKIPYTDADPAKGHAATAADPNEVSYIELTSADVRDKDYDIIFNRDAGKWRVRFYFTLKQIGTGQTSQYVFKYTINGYKSVLRTYCSSVAQKPKADSNIKVYGAYAFEGNETEKSGKIKLYEMNYIPAKEGVILYSSNTIDEATIETVMDTYTPDASEAKYINIPNENYKNYLVGTLENTIVNASVFDGNNVRTHRNFFFNYLSNTGYNKEGATDYLGFFRIESGNPCKANHAYLSLPTDVLAWNGQTFGQVMDKFEASGEPANLTKGMRIVFSDGSDWEENTTTAISVVKQAKPADNAYYTLQGVRVAAPAKGIYIHNGKKTIIR